MGTYRELVTCGYLHIGRTLSDLLVVGFRERSGGRSQFELVMGGGMLSLGLAAGGPLRVGVGVGVSGGGGAPDVFDSDFNEVCVCELGGCVVGVWV